MSNANSFKHFLDEPRANMNSIKWVCNLRSNIEIKTTKSSRTTVPNVYFKSTKSKKVNMKL